MDARTAPRGIIERFAAQFGVGVVVRGSSRDTPRAWVAANSPQVALASGSNLAASVRRSLLCLELLPVSVEADKWLRRQTAECSIDRSAGAGGLFGGGGSSVVRSANYRPNPAESEAAEAAKVLHSAAENGRFERSTIFGRAIAPSRDNSAGERTRPKPLAAAAATATFADMRAADSIAASRRRRRRRKNNSSCLDASTLPLARPLASSFLPRPQKGPRRPAQPAPSWRCWLCQINQRP